MKKVIQISILISLLFALGCGSEDKMIKFYKKNKEEIHKLKQLSIDLKNKYEFDYSSLRDLGKNVGIRFSVHDKNPFKGTGEYFNRRTFQPMLFSSNNTNICDSCTEVEREIYSTLLKDTILKEILKLYVELNPKAIKINSDGIFIALGNPIKHPNKSEVEGGVFLSFKEDFDKELVIKEIDKNVFLFDAVIH